MVKCQIIHILVFLSVFQLAAIRISELHAGIADSGSKSAGPNLEWAVTFGGEDQDRVSGVAVDRLGNIYVTGSFQGTVDFDPGPGSYELTSHNIRDIYLSKFDGYGHLIWAISLGGQDIDIARDLFVDNDGNIYLAGRIKGEVDFNPGWVVEIQGTEDDIDAFICKYDRDGNYIWSETLGGHGTSSVESVVVGSDGDIILGGWFADSLALDIPEGPVNLVSSGETDSFICSLDSSGVIQWVRAWGSPGSEYCSGIDIDDKGDIYVYGQFDETIDFDPGPQTALKTAYLLERNAYLSKFDPEGNFLWVQTWNGRPPSLASGISVTGPGDVFITGSFYEPVDLDPTYLIERHISNRFTDSFLSCFGSDGEYNWGMAWGGNYFDSVSEITIDDKGNIYLLGIFQGTVDFDPGEKTDIHESHGSKHYFLTRLDSSGEYSWTRVWDSTEMNIGIGITVDGASNVYIVGTFEDTIDFGLPGDTDSHTSNGSFDVSLMKISTP